MSLIGKLTDILAESRAEYEEIMSGNGSEFRVDSMFGADAHGGFSSDMNSELRGADSAPDGNLLAVGDNTAFMRWLMHECGMAGKVQLIYIDPPFYSRANYGSEIKLSSEKLGKMPAMKQIAYTDSWQEGTFEYLKMLCTRFYMMRDLLSEEGCLWVHLDWHIVHYVKVLLDEIFGEKNFINEVIWNYKSGGSSKKHYARKHDTLLFYAKSPKYYFAAQKEKSYNRGYKPYRFKGVKEYRDETGWYTMVNMKDVWQLDMVGRTSSERTGYATQKPEALIARILESCTREGDVVCDFFGGSGTLASAADKMGRKWIYCDLGSLAASSAKKRMVGNGSSFSVLVQNGHKAADTCDIEVGIDISDAGAASGKLLTAELLGYRANENSVIPVDEKNLKILRGAMNKDPLRFIDFWSIDYSYDGKVHRADDVFCREKGVMVTSGGRLVQAEEDSGKSPGTYGKGFVSEHGKNAGIGADTCRRAISIKAHDIFGNTAEKIMYIK